MRINQINVERSKTKGARPAPGTGKTLRSDAEAMYLAWLQRAGKLPSRHILGPSEAIAAAAAKIMSAFGDGCVKGDASVEFRHHLITAGPAAAIAGIIIGGLLVGPAHGKAPGTSLTVTE